MKKALQTQKKQADFLAKSLGIPTFDKQFKINEEEEHTKEEYAQAMEDMACWGCDQHLKVCNKHEL